MSSIQKKTTGLIWPFGCMEDFVDFVCAVILVFLAWQWSFVTTAFVATVGIGIAFMVTSRLRRGLKRHAQGQQATIDCLNRALATRDREIKALTQDNEALLSANHQWQIQNRFKSKQLETKQTDVDNRTEVLRQQWLCFLTLLAKEYPSGYREEPTSPSKRPDSAAPPGPTPLQLFLYIDTPQGPLRFQIDPEEQHTIGELPLYDQAPTTTLEQDHLDILKAFVQKQMLLEITHVP